jgi:predicted Fe-Mo cluster-binding NifX family protein
MAHNNFNNPLNCKFLFSIMKVAITSTGNSQGSTIDPRFGRCAWFIIYDTESKSIEFIPNPYKDSDEDSGPASIKLLETRNVSKIISGEFGFKVKPVLDKLKIQMIVIKESNRKIFEIIDLLNH